MIEIYGESETLIFSKTILFSAHFPFCCIVSTASELPFVELQIASFHNQNEKLVIIYLEDWAPRSKIVRRLKDLHQTFKLHSDLII